MITTSQFTVLGIVIVWNVWLSIIHLLWACNYIMFIFVTAEFIHVTDIYITLTVTSNSLWQVMSRHSWKDSATQPKVKYFTQVKARPPTFVAFMSGKTELSDTDIRFLTRSLKEDFNIGGIPIRILQRSIPRKASSFKSNIKKRGSSIKRMKTDKRTDVSDPTQSWFYNVTKAPPDSHRGPGICVPFIREVISHDMLLTCILPLELKMQRKSLSLYRLAEETEKCPLPSTACGQKKGL